MSIKIIGKENIKFILKYIKTRAFESHKLIIWIVAFGTLMYFEHLISNAKSVSISEVFDRSILLSLFVMFLLFSVNTYAFLDAKNSIKLAEETKKDLERAQFWKVICDVAKIGSWFIPGGIFAKLGFFAISSAANVFIDNHVENEITRTLIKNITIMVLLAVVNMTIVVISTYLITGHILFW